MRNVQRLRRGNSLVESALVLVMFLAIFVGLFDIGEILFMQQTLAFRAHSAARWGAVNAFDATAVRNLVLYGTTQPEPGQHPIFGLTASNVNVVRSNPGTVNDRIIVTVSGYTLDFMSLAIVRLNAGAHDASPQVTGMAVQVTLPYEYSN